MSKPQRYTERYWTAQQIEKAKFRAADICRWLNRDESVYRYQLHPRFGLRQRMKDIYLRRRK